jgi:hypothetical protein
MHIFHTFIIGLSVVAFSAAASAATVQVKSGEVFIDRGSGYKSVPGSAAAKAGDVVMVLAGGSGEVVYDDGCRQAVDVGAVVTVGETSPCAALTTGSVDYTLVVGGVVVAGGVAAAIALSGSDGGASN